MTGRLGCVTIQMWIVRPAIEPLYIVNTVTLPLVGLVPLGPDRHPYFTGWWWIFAALVSRAKKTLCYKLKQQILTPIKSSMKPCKIRAVKNV